MKRPLLQLIVLCAALSPSGRASSQPQASRQPDYCVVVNSKNPLAQLDRKFVANIFLKKTNLWPSGDVIRPVDLPPESRVRHRFSTEVLGRSVAAVQNYWQQSIFSGRNTPPPQLVRDDDIVRYVTQHKGAIGYSTACNRTSGVKILVIQ